MVETRSRPPSELPPGRYVRQPRGPLTRGNRAAALTEFQAGARAHAAQNLPAAVAAYQRAVRLDPSLYEAHHNLAIAALDSGDIALSLIAGEYALTANPASPEAQWNFAIALQRGRYASDAAEEFQRIVTSQPGNAEAHLMLAGLYASDLRQNTRARAHYQMVLQLAPNHPQAPAIRSWMESNP